MVKFLAACAVLITGLSPCSADDRSTGPISTVDVEPHVRFLASAEQRGRSGKGSERAADYIRAHFRDLGLKPLFADGEFFQPIPGRNGPAGKNIGAWLPGSDPKLRDEFIIISAHYDHLGVRNGMVFPGADDNASGVAMMLEVARKLATAETGPRRSIAFVGFDLEERMLWGSRWFATHPPWPLSKLKLFITADMIGRSLGDLPLESVFVLGSEHAPMVKTFLDEAPTPDKLEVSRLGIDLIGTRSDYGPFRDRKIPFLFFSTGEHPDYHTVRDTVERLDIPKVARVSQYVLSVTELAADAEETPEWIDNPGPDVDEAKTLNRISKLLLDAGEGELNDVQRMTVSWVHSRTSQIIERGEMTKSERTWLTRMSQVLLLSVL